MNALNVSSFIWGIADDVLRDVYVRGKYRDVILPMTVIRRLDAVLEPTKEAVRRMKAQLDAAGITNQDRALRQASGEAFYNTSPFRLRDLASRGRQQQLRADFEAYLDGFSPNVQEVLEKFKFRNQISTLVEADALGFLIEKFLDSSVNLSPRPVMNGDGSVRLEGLDNHGMGTVFEELIRRFNEENNEEAGEHFTPRDVVQLMARLIFLPVADEVRSGTYLVYDGACGTGGMLTVAEETLTQLAGERGKETSVHLYGQEVNPETYAISKADLILKGEGGEADNMQYGSTLSADAFPAHEFDFMLSNPPYGKSWKSDLERMGGKADDQGPTIRRGARRRARSYSLITRSSDGQMMFLANMLSKMKHGHPDGQPHRRGPQRQLAVHGRRRAGREQHPPLDYRERLAGGHRRAPAQHVLQHRHRHLHLGAQQPQAGPSPGPRTAHRRLADGPGRCARTWAARIVRSRTKTSGASATPSWHSRKRMQSKIFPNKDFGYWKITVERPLRLEGIRPGTSLHRQGDQSPRRTTMRTLGDRATRHQENPRQKRTASDPLRGLFPDH